MYFEKYFRLRDYLCQEQQHQKLSSSGVEGDAQGPEFGSQPWPDLSQHPAGQRGDLLNPWNFQLELTT